MKSRNLAIHTTLTILLIVFFFGKLVNNINTKYFSRDGDGFRTYYGMYFHAKWGKNNHQLDAMNYPYGEVINFTDCQPPVTNVTRLISKHLFDITDYSTGINNGLMLFSILLASIFLYLIFTQLKLPFWYASIVSLGITFLSPQIQRMGGHFSLSWVFWIPLSIYLLQLFDEKKSWTLSIIIGLSAYLSGAMHFYFLAFWIFLYGPYWLYRWFIKFEKRSIYRVDWLHILIQVALPVLVLQLMLKLNDPVVDRTANPWGFYEFRGHFAAVFLPLFKSYFPLFNEWNFAKRFSWESFIFIGIVGSAGFFTLVFIWLKKTIRFKKSQSLTNQPFFNYLLSVSLLVLLFSFGIPFVLGLDKLREFLGPLGQLRGVARFGWLFFYAINIVVFTLIYKNWLQNKTFTWKQILAYCSVALLCFEAYNYTQSISENLNNSIPELDGELAAQTDSIFNTINSSEFQAILPLPYFHIGSESSWIESECDIMKWSFIASMKTGLPNMGVMAARTSISQAYKSIALVSLPWDSYEILKNFQNKKAILITVAHCDALSSDELRLVQNAQFLARGNQSDLYKMDFDSLRNIPTKYNFSSKYRELHQKISHLAADSMAYVSSSANSEEVVRHKVSKEFQRILETPSLKLNAEQPLYVRFWVRNYVHDLVPRTQLLVIQSAPDHQTLEEKYTDIFRHLRTFDADWALVEIEIQPKQEREIIKLLFKNPTLSGTEFQFKDFTISQLPFGRD